MEKKRSVGVTAFGWFYIIAAVLGIFLFLFSFPRRIEVLIKFIFSIPLLLVTGIGILKLKKWARKLAIIIAIGGVLFQLISHIRINMMAIIPLNYNPIMLNNILSPWALAGIIIYFFTRPKVKEQFRYGGLMEKKTSWVDFMKKLSRWEYFVLFMSIIFGFSIWVWSQYFTGAVEPWDAKTPYYIISLLLAGGIAGLISPKHFWLWVIGIWIGQTIYGFYDTFRLLCSGSGGMNFFIPIGMFFIAAFSLTSLLGAWIGMGLRLLIRRGLKSLPDPK